MMEERLILLYLINPDPIFYGTLDQRIIETFQKEDVDVIQTDLESLSFIMGQGEITFFKDGKPLHFDGFLAYGYMSDKHYQDYYYFNMAVKSAGKVTLHSASTEQILQDKLLQYIKYTEHQIPIPKTGVAFTIPSFTDMLRHFKDRAIMKEVTGYEGKGVELTRNKNQGLNLFSKALWKENQMLIQNFIEDSYGQSIRVLVIGGKAQSVIQFQDSNSFKSNSYSNDWSGASLMDSQNKEQYFQIAEKACKSVDENLTIGGVDLLESKDGSIYVLEINSWPEIDYSQEFTNLPLFQMFAQEFKRKMEAIQDKRVRLEGY